MLASVRGRGGPVLSRVAPLPRAPRGGELLLRVEAAGVNPVDYKLPRLVAGRITGMDVSGVVEAVGDESDSGGFTVGDAVWGRGAGMRDELREVAPGVLLGGLGGLHDCGLLRRLVDDRRLLRGLVDSKRLADDRRSI